MWDGSHNHQASINGRHKSVFFYVFYKSPKCQRRAASSEIIKLDRALTLNSSSLKQNLVISVCFNYAQVLPKLWIFIIHIIVKS